MRKWPDKEVYFSRTLKVGKTPIELRSADPNFSTFGQTRKMLIVQHNNPYNLDCKIGPEGAKEGFFNLSPNTTFHVGTSVKFFVHCPHAEDVEINVQEVWTDNPLER